MKRISLVFVQLFIFCTVRAQYIGEKQTTYLKNHVSYLADDKLEGRLTGSKGEQLALEYISAEFKKAGIKPAGAQGYVQPFGFTEKIFSGDNTSFSINGKTIDKNDYFPLSYSGNGSVTGDIYFAGFGIHAPQLNYDDYKGNGNRQGKIFIIDISSPDGLHPHSKYADHTGIAKKIETAKGYGAAAIVFMTDDKDAELPSSKLNVKITPYDIPVIFYKNKIDYLTVDEISVTVDVQKKSSEGHNVIGFIDNKAATTVVIGAHFDHLGYGDEDHSLYRGEPAIHNGADDNASGTSALIEIARVLAKSKWKNNNYLFIAFSGEELGLLGSNYFAKSELFSKYNINYMINMDMVGRLEEADKTLIINGAGTSPVWPEALSAIRIGGIKIKTTESGVGPSDHTSFYLKDIPVLHFFSGTHNDYHKPSDDADKINYKGMQEICDFILTLIANLDSKGKIEFTKTKETEPGKVSPFKVTLGVVPDYAYDGEGLRIDGVSDGKPAATAGLKAGDIVIQMGEEKIKDIYAYMAALGKFKKGDEVEVIFKRGTEEQKVKVKF